MANDCKVEIVPIEAEELKARDLAEVDGILVPGGFGVRGVEGKIAAIRYARERKIPFLGICLGMQCAVIEYARDVVGWEDANSTEFDEGTKHPVIDLMEEQRGITQKGGTMRLGAYPCLLAKGSLAEKLYGASEISERHRHRYELAMRSEGREALAAAGLVVSGTSPDGSLAEMVELPGKDHPYFVACQFHPEFKSRPTAPHPLFLGLVSAAVRHASGGDGGK